MCAFWKLLPAIETLNKKRRLVAIYVKTNYNYNSENKCLRCMTSKHISYIIYSHSYQPLATTLSSKLQHLTGTHKSIANTKIEIYSASS